MNSDKRLANAFAAKSARACDNCVKRRASWYCPADDAFLCQSCDSSVHSANSLARRHERVRLRIGSLKPLDAKAKISEPSWHVGFTRKARTPRQKKDSKLTRTQNPVHIVPQLFCEEHSHQENEEQNLYRVPIFDPSFAESADCSGQNPKFLVDDLGREMNAFSPSDVDVTELLNFEYDCAVVTEEEENKNLQIGCLNASRKTNFLRLDYEGVILSWDGQKSPWMSGERPELDPGDWWPDPMGACRTQRVYEEIGSHAAMIDSGREARVLRYKEKRRTRLFSKKIRYEVRRLNAEKRPRMKGRFVKRTNFVTPTVFPLLNK